MTLPAIDPYKAIVNDLAYSYDGVFSRESVAAAVTAARDVLEPVSTIHTFLPILVARGGPAPARGGVVPRRAPWPA
jgi:arsenate reductase